MNFKKNQYREKAWYNFNSMNLKYVIRKVPSDPGIYIFKGKHGQILYVGKAVNLKARLGSYLRPGWKEGMLREAKSLSWEKLGSDVEALIREAMLIKMHRPRYNIVFRDDKNYFFVAFTRDRFPRIYLTHQPLKEKNTYIGPFTDGAAIKHVLKLLRRAFPYCTCSNKNLHRRRCINAEIGRCLSYCCVSKPHTKREERLYRANISAIKKILEGKTRSLTQALEKKMKQLSKTRHYEDAKIVRDQLSSLRHIFEHQPFLQKEISEERLRALSSLKDLLHLKNIPRRIEGYDISHHQGSSSVASMVVFENGVPKKSDYRKFIIRSVAGINDPAMIGESLRRRMKHPEWPTPDFILIDGGKGQLNAARVACKNKNIAIASIAKRDEELYSKNQRAPYELKKLPPPLLYLLTHIRNESHRFAISFHRKRQTRLMLG